MSKDIDHSCIDCENFGSEGASADDPYPSMWCRKDVFDGCDSQDDVDMLYDDNDCPEWEPSLKLVNKLKPVTPNE